MRNEFFLRVLVVSIIFLFVVNVGENRTLKRENQDLKHKIRELKSSGGSFEIINAGKWEL